MISTCETNLRKARNSPARSEEHTSELQSRRDLVCRLLLEYYRDHRDLHSFPTRRSSDLGVDGLSLRFIVCARQHLSHESQRYQLNSANQQEDRRKQKRAMLLHDLHMRNEFTESEEQPCEIGRAHV